MRLVLCQRPPPPVNYTHRLKRLLREPEIKTSAIPEDNVSELRTLTRLRYEMMQEAVSLKQKLLCLLDLVFPEYKNFFSEVFGEASRQLLGQFPSAAEIAKVDIRRLTNLLSKASRESDRCGLPPFWRKRFLSLIPKEKMALTLWSPQPGLIPG